MINKTIIYIQLTQLLLQGCPARPGLTGGVGPLHRLHDDWGGRGVVGEGGAVHVHVELALPLPCVPPHVPPTLTLAQPALGGEVSVADQVHVCSKSGVRTEYRAGSVSSCLQSCRRRRWNTSGMDQSSEASGRHYWANSARIFRICERMRMMKFSPLLSAHLLVVPALHSHIPHSQ